MSKERERQSKYRGSRQSKSKVPLTFYRSSGAAGAEESPFKKKESAAQPGKIASIFNGFLEWIVFFALVGLLAYSLVIRPSSVVVINSETFHQEGVYKDAVNKILKGIKYSNKVTFDEQDMTRKLQKAFPEVASAWVELPIFAQSPVVHLQISSPSFILNSNNESYIVDSQGVTVAKAADFPSFHDVLTVEDQSGFRASIGQQVMSADSVNFIKTLERQSNRSKINIKSLTLPRSAEGLELHTADRPYFVKFYLGGDAMQQTGQFLAARHQFDTTSSQPAEYLDVRVPGKIFYK
jgi:cell division septal protein FtsQ